MSNNENARAQAIIQAESIKQMVDALNCDYDRLDELGAQLNSYNEAVNDENAVDAEYFQLTPAESEELAELKQAAGDCKSFDEAVDRISEDPLEISVRSGWSTPCDSLTPEEFRILLCTGGPAVQIIGELNSYGEPCRAWIEYQDWFTNWEELVDDSVDYDALLQYCRQFYFGQN